MKTYTILQIMNSQYLFSKYRDQINEKYGITFFAGLAYDKTGKSICGNIKVEVTD